MERLQIGIDALYNLIEEVVASWHEPDFEKARSVLDYTAHEMNSGIVDGFCGIVYTEEELAEIIGYVEGLLEDFCK